ncbi:hypothetical protein B566_EDAN014101 [Ephemera danica]|nr:hypothetical protein B566_EDAN014101 [Ephemera danica]
MQASYLLLLVTALTSATWASNTAPKVSLDQGVLRGKTLKSRSGRTIFSFQGVPYAAPPIGSLRFKPPQDAPSWQGERPAIQDGNDCPQFHFVLDKFVGTEDCLFANVYTPKLDGEGLSVMLWVHGGGFFSGSGNSEMYGPELLLDHDVVLVTFNYRVDLLGFLSLNNTETSGNYGLKDQVAALKWVQKNIAKFGGNPNSVTIFGESAGGASIHFLMLSPLSRGLFHRAIAQSGSAYSYWAVDKKPEENSRAVAANVGCRQQDPKELIECLRQVDVVDLITASNAYKHANKHTVLFIPSIEPQNTEGAFITECPNAMMARVQRGKSAEERYNDKDIQERYIPDAGLNLKPGSEEFKSIWQKIDSFYDSITNNVFIDKYILLESDIMFVLGVDKLVHDVAALKRSPVYYYEFTYDGGLNLLKQLAQIKLPGVCHADELAYLFTQSLMHAWKKAPMDDVFTIGRITKLWTNFARTGNPTPDDTMGVTWTPVSTEYTCNVTPHFLDIGKELVMKAEDPRCQRLAFWRELLEEQQSSSKSTTPNTEL